MSKSFVDQSAVEKKYLDFQKFTITESDSLHAVENTRREKSGSPRSVQNVLRIGSQFLRRFRSHLTRSLSKVKSELGPT